MAAVLHRQRKPANDACPFELLNGHDDPWQCFLLSRTGHVVFYDELDVVDDDNGKQEAILRSQHGVKLFVDPTKVDDSLLAPEVRLLYDDIVLMVTN